MSVSEDLELFEPSSDRDPGPEAVADPTSQSIDPAAPLAARMRPRSLDEFRGQEQLLGHGRPLRAMIDSGQSTSMILWAPPGSGKTTLARLIAEASDAAFVSFSAVTEGIPRVREIIAEARQRRAATGRRTILLCDEIHRFNKAQQDAFLPHVEEGVVVLIGATTENPSFEIVRPLLSRALVSVLAPLAATDLRDVLLGALGDGERGLGDRGLTWEEEALRLLAEAADGDARRALGAAAALVGVGGRIDEEAAREGLQHRFAVYDKGGEEHYNLISALHKAVRGSDPDAALYWLARMIDGGGRSALPSPAAGAHGIRGHRARRSVCARRDYGRSGLLPFPWRTRGGIGARRGDAVPGDRAQVQPGLRGLAGGDAARARDHGRVGSPPHPERSHWAHEGAGVRQGIPLRSGGGGRCRRPELPPRSLGGRELLRTGSLRRGNADPGAA